MLIWLYNFINVIVIGGWMLLSSATLAYGIQGTWRPENKYWPAAIIVGLLSLAAFFTTVITYL